MSILDGMLDENIIARSGLAILENLSIPDLAVILPNWNLKTSQSQLNHILIVRLILSIYSWLPISGQFSINSLEDFFSPRRNEVKMYSEGLHGTSIVHALKHKVGG
jgi:hypothetical protein